MQLRLAPSEALSGAATSSRAVWRQQGAPMPLLSRHLWLRAYRHRHGGGRAVLLRQHRLQHGSGVGADGGVAAAAALPGDAAEPSEAWEGEGEGEGVEAEGANDEDKLARLTALTEIERIKEMQRRKRISDANRGRTPWNKGRRHSPETIAKIRASTTKAMARPDVRAKLVAFNETQRRPHDEATKAKIREVLQERSRVTRKIIRQQCEIVMVKMQASEDERLREAAALPCALDVLCSVSWSVLKKDWDQLAAKWDESEAFRERALQKIHAKHARAASPRSAQVRNKVKLALDTFAKLKEARGQVEKAEAAVAKLQHVKLALAGDPDRLQRAAAAEQQAQAILETLRAQVDRLTAAMGPLAEYLSSDGMPLAQLGKQQQEPQQPAQQAAAPLQQAEQQQQQQQPAPAPAAQGPALAPSSSPAVQAAAEGPASSEQPRATLQAASLAAAQQVEDVAAAGAASGGSASGSQQAHVEASSLRGVQHAWRMPASGDVQLPPGHPAVDVPAPGSQPGHGASTSGGGSGTGGAPAVNGSPLPWQPNGSGGAPGAGANGFSRPLGLGQPRATILPIASAAAAVGVSVLEQRQQQRRPAAAAAAVAELEPPAREQLPQQLRPAPVEQLAPVAVPAPPRLPLASAAPGLQQLERAGSPVPAVAAGEATAPQRPLGDTQARAAAPAAPASGQLLRGLASASAAIPLNGSLVSHEEVVRVASQLRDRVHSSSNGSRAAAAAPLAPAAGAAPVAAAIGSAASAATPALSARVPLSAAPAAEPLAAAEAAAVEEEEEAGPTAPKRRGRPRKPVSAEQQADAEPKRRGRPRKYPEAPPPPPGAMPRRRGRPRKVDDDDEDELEFEAGSAAGTAGHSRAQSAAAPAEAGVPAEGAPGVTSAATQRLLSQLLLLPRRQLMTPQQQQLAVQQAAAAAAAAAAGGTRGAQPQPHLNGASALRSRLPGRQ